MIRDLNDPSATLTPRECDVAIVGAGIAGSIIACELARRGRRVVVLESGGLAQPADTHPLNRVVHTAQEYKGAEHGRFRCLGGTSSRWGGAMIPFQPEDLRGGTGPFTEARWPVGLQELMPYVPRVEAIFSLPLGEYDAPLSNPDDAFCEPASFRVRTAKWPAFRNRNVANLFATELKAPNGPDIWLNATLTAIGLGDNGRVSALHAKSAAGGAMTIRAREVVLAAGAIESTRTLLKLDADHDRRLFGSKDVLGRYFHDHLSAPVARIDRPDRKGLDKLTGFRFDGSGMRNTRFELEGKVRYQRGLPGAFVHIASSSSRPNGFDGLRAIYRAVQRKQLPAAGDVSLLMSHSGWFARAAWSRFVERRVLPPDDAEYEVHLVTEQVPARENRIRLSDSERDMFGVPLAEIDWRVSRADIDGGEAVLDTFAQHWSMTPLVRLGALQRYERSRWSEAMAHGGGIYHPGGSVRMAESAAAGVLDRDLRVFEISNLRVVSTAAFPSGGSSNPTMMLILFALRTADQLAAVF